MPSVTDRTLGLQLKYLQNDGVIKRKVYTAKPSLKVAYSLTSFGKTLMQLLIAIVSWGQFVDENYEENIDLK
jgi:DNA-binding HxlR family transcriptional regulator